MTTKTKLEIEEKIEETIQKEEPSLTFLASDKNENLVQNLNIYHSELIYQNEELNRINLELQYSEKRFADLYNMAPVAYFVFNVDGIIESVNQAFCKLVHQEKRNLEGLKITSLLSPVSQDEYYFFMRSISQNAEIKTELELYFLVMEKDVPTNVVFNRYEENKKIHIRAAVFDLSEIKHLLHEIQLEKERYEIIANQSHDILFEYRIKEDVMKYSQQFYEITGEDTTVPMFRTEMLHNKRIYPDDLTEFLSIFEQIRSNKKTITSNMRFTLSQDSEYVWYRIHGTLISDKEEPVCVVGTITNIDSNVKEKQALTLAAETDSLTKLLNKETAQQRIATFLQKEGKNGRHAILIVDVDNFKAINDNLGHMFGDAVLSEISIKLQSLLNEKDIIGRIGGDEFIILMKNVDDQKVGHVTQNICSMIKNVFTYERTHYNLSASVGICIYPQQASTFLDLFYKADVALYASKEKGKDCYTIYDTSLKLNYNATELMNQYRKVVPHEQRHYADLVLVTNIIELLFEGKDLESSIMLILSLLGNHYKVSHACLMEVQSNQEYAKITYEWYMDENDHRMSAFSSISATSFHNYKRLFNSDGVFCCYDVDMMKQGDVAIWETARGLGIKTSLQCALMEKGKIYGFIALDDFEEPRLWAQEDSNSFTLIVRSISAYLSKLHAQQKSDYFESVDVITNAFNLSAFTRYATTKLEEWQKGQYAMISLDIKEFKYYNKVYGFAEGNAILKAFSQIVCENKAEDEYICRVGADIFAILLHYEHLEAFQKRIEKLLKDICYIKTESGHFYKLNIKAGIYLMDAGDTAILRAMDCAGLARRESEKSPSCHYLYYIPQMEQNLLRITFIENNVEEAMQRQEFLVVYQPKVNMHNGKVIGAEALVRWNSPQKGMLFPDTFIHVLESSGHIVDLDLYVLDKVCQKIKKLNDIGVPIIISVNYSRMHLYTDSSIPRTLEVLNTWGISPRQIEIEIIENAFTKDLEVLQVYAKHLQEKGFRVSMDDFGSGYSSLNLLKDLSIDVMKIDREFLQQDHLSKRGRIIIENVVRMARELGIDIIAEGVETKEQADFLLSVQCNVAQGYYYSKPIGEKAFDEFLKKNGMDNQ